MVNLSRIDKNVYKSLGFKNKSIGQTMIKEVLQTKVTNYKTVPMTKITIITPSYRIDNLYKIKESINFEYVHEWIIVYDGSKIITNPYLFKEDNKIKEYIYKCTGISGNGQRNYALSKITNENTLLYYLDDDNIIHPNLYNLLNNINNNTIYSFNQYNRIKGGNPNIGYIDTAMVLIPFNLCKNIIWKLDIYEADGHYIKDCIDSNRDKHVYIDEDLCYYNFLK